jgi:serine/threonine protein kinase
MELVDGPTLADRIAQGPIPIAEALPIAKQIAEALEAAHEQGTIHRDLKPANIKLRPDGVVKVLDFGLAEALQPAGAMSPNVSQSLTITAPAMTGVGVILGTAAYMSPEQAKGRGADKRSDVWAFGCVLYEMLTGKPCFGVRMSQTLYVRPYPAVNGGRWQVSTGGGTRPLWSRTGQELFYASPAGAIMRVDVERGTSWAATTPTTVVKEGYVIPSGFPGRFYDVSSDGQRFLMVKSTSDPTAPPPQIVVVQHFDEELKRLVPVN